MANEVVISVKADTRTATKDLEGIASTLDRIAVQAGELGKALGGKVNFGRTTKEEASVAIASMKAAAEQAKADAARYAASERTKQESIKQTNDVRRAAVNDQKQLARVETELVKAQNEMVRAAERNQAAVLSLRKAEGDAAVATARSTQEKLTALDSEIARRKEVVKSYEEQFAAAQRLASVAQKQVDAFNPDIDGGDSEAVKSMSDAIKARNDAERDAEQITRRLVSARTSLTSAERQQTSLTNQQTKEQEQQNKAQEKATQEAEKFAAAQNGVSASTTGATRNLAGSRYALYEIAAAYGAAATAALGFTKSSISAAIEQEKAFAQVARTTEGTVAELQPLHQSLRDLTTEIPEAFEEMAKIAQLGGQLGFQASELERFTEVVAKFSASTGMGVEETATAFGKMSNLLHISIDEFENLGSAIAQLGVNTVATDPQITKTAQELSGVGYAAGLSTEAILGMAASFASLDVQPERARSSVLRLFRNVDLAIAESGDTLKAWANQIGLSVQEFESLRQNSPDEIFTRFVKSLQDARDAGQNLTVVFENLGIQQVRDVDALARMAGSYDLLTQSISDARVAYLENTFLAEASEKIFTTLSARITEMGAAWDNLKASFGETGFIQGGIGAVVDALKEIMTWLANNLPSGVKTAIVAFAAFVGVIMSIKTALALALAGLLAFQYVLNAGMKTSQISVRGVWGELQKVRAEIRGVAGDSTLSTTTVVGDAARQRQAMLSVEQAAMARNKAILGVSAMPVMAGGGAMPIGGPDRALSGWAKVGGFAKSLGGMVAIGAAISVIAGVTDAIIESGRAAEREQQRIEAFQNTVIQAGGGFSQFADALHEDNLALAELGEKATQADEYVGQLFTSYRRVADKTVESKRYFEDAAGGLHELSSKTITTVGSADQFISKMKDAGAVVDETNGFIRTQIELMADQSRAFLEQSIRQSFLQDDSPIDAAKFNEVADQLETRGINIYDVLVDSAEKGYKGALETIKPFLQEIDSDAADIQDKIDKRTQAMRKRAVEQGMAGDPLLESRIANDPILNNWNAQLQELLEGRAAIVGVTQDMGGMAGKMAEQARAASRGLKENTEDTEDLADGLKDAAGNADELAKKLKAAADSFKELSAGLLGQEVAIGNVAKAMQALGESVAENGATFDTMTNAGRANLDAMNNAIMAQSAILEQAVANGEISTAEASLRMGQFIVNMLNNLRQIGVPDEALRALVAKMNAITGNKWQVNIGADISAAIQGVTTLQAAIARVANNTAKAFGVNLLGTKYSAFTEMTVPSQTIFAAPNSDQFNMLGAYNSKMKDLAGSTKAAGGAGKNLQDEHEKALKAIQDALDKLVGTYNNFSKSVFGMSDATTDFHRSLQEMGLALAENGLSFNRLTKTGDENFKKLEAVVDSGAKMIGEKLSRGLITDKQAAKQFDDVLQMVYTSLKNLGASDKVIRAFFKGMGVDVTKKDFDGLAKSVQQFSGTMEKSMKAAQKAMKETRDKAKETADYVSRLSDAFKSLNDTLFGRQNAADDAASKFNSMADAIKRINEQIDELNKKNAGLDSQISGQSAIAAGAEQKMMQALSANDPELAKAYQFQRDSALAQVEAAKAEQAKNKDEVKNLEKSKYITSGNTQEAIDNRNAIQDLFKSYQDMISAYAATGKSQEQVGKYSDTLKAKFIEQVRQLGFNQSTVDTYTTAWDNLKAAIEKVPDVKQYNAQVKVEGPDLSPADAAMNAFTSKAYKASINATVTGESKQQAREAMKSLTAARDALIKARKDAKTFNSVENSLRSLASPRTATVTVNERRNMTVRVGNTTLTYAQYAALKGGYNAGGLVKRGFAGGGLVPGRPPGDASVDNILAKGPGGMFAIRSGEFVLRQPAVNYYGLPMIEALNRMQIPNWALTGQRGGSTSNTTYNGNTGVSMNITNVNPQAEPTSVSINRALALSAGLGNLS